jgi:hypothetical protein
VALVRGTFQIPSRGDGLHLAATHLSWKPSGVLYGADPASSSYKYEPESTFIKLATDVALVGQATPPKAGMTNFEVGFRVGSMRRFARVVGDRVFVKKLGLKSISKPKPIDRIPLNAEHAFGGFDKTAGSEAKPRYEPRNPVGRGYRHSSGKWEEGVALPNVEELDDPLKSWGQTVKPALFGFTSPNWQPRAKYAGTYDKKWDKERKPLLPKDFDRRFFNAAPPELIAPGYLKGDEEVQILNAGPAPNIHFRLPGLPPPEIRVELRHGADQRLRTALDTVVVNTDDMIVILTWRVCLPLRSGPLDVRTIEVQPIASSLQAGGARRKVQV